jgi:hypothetical protein
MISRGRSDFVALALRNLCTVNPDLAAWILIRMNNINTTNDVLANVTPAIAVQVIINIERIAPGLSTSIREYYQRSGGE